MEKLHYIFNAQKGALVNEEEVIMCEPFFGSSLCDGIRLIRDKDFIILGEIAIAARGAVVAEDDELIAWVANKVKELKKESSISAESTGLAALIVNKICEFKGIRQ